MHKKAKMTKNDPKWPKMTQNDQKMRKKAKMTTNDPKWPKMIKNA